MITPISINRQNINFQARAKMDKQSKKVGQYFEDHNIDVNKVLIASGVSAAGAAGVLLGSPDMVSSPEAAKYGIILPMVSTAGVMGVNHIKGQQAKKQKEQAEAAAKGEPIIQEQPVQESVIQEPEIEIIRKPKKTSGVTCKEWLAGKKIPDEFVDHSYNRSSASKNLNDFWAVIDALSNL